MTYFGAVLQVRVYAVCSANHIDVTHVGTDLAEVHCACVVQEAAESRYLEHMSMTLQHL